LNKPEKEIREKSVINKLEDTHLKMPWEKLAEEIFKLIDVYNDGVITKELFSNFCQKAEIINKYDVEYVDDFFNEMDTDQSGEIDITK
jgi:Ca2+-binding EF-hand superfamily protein